MSVLRLASSRAVPATALGAALVLLTSIGCSDPRDDGSDQADSSNASAPASSSGSRGAVAPPSGAAGGAPTATPSSGTSGASAGDPDPRTARFAGYVAPKPPKWLWQPPQSSMRAANYVVPAIGEGSQAELVIFAGIGGSNEQNIARWAGQFRTAEQRSVQPEVTTMQAGDLELTIVELAGEYMKSGSGFFTPDQRFIGALTVTPNGPLQIRLSGPDATVTAAKEDFMTFLREMRLEGSEAPATAPAADPYGDASDDGDSDADSSALDVRDPAEGFPDSWYVGGSAGPLQGSPAPAFAASQWFASEPLTLEDLRGSIVVVDFWGTWCGPCIRLIPKNVALQDQYGDDGVVVLGIHSTNDPLGDRGMATIDEKITELGIDYPVFQDADETMQNAFAVGHWPYYAVIDRNGIVVADDVHPDRLEDVIASVLAHDGSTG